MNRVFITESELIQGNRVENGSRILDEQQYTLDLDKLELRYYDKISQLIISTSQKIFEKRKFRENGGHNNCSLFFGTEYGVLDSIHRFNMVAVSQGALYVNPGLFPNTVLNAPACRGSILLSLSGPVFSIYNGMVSGIDAVGIGFTYLRSGLSPCALAGGADEVADLHQRMHHHNEGIGEACGFFLLESSPVHPSPFKSMEIIGYNTISFPENREEPVRRISHFIKETFNVNSLRSEHLRHVKISHFLMNGEARQEAEQICASLERGCEMEFLNTDWMGASGLVQLSALIHGRERGGRAGGFFMVLGIERDRVSFLLLK